MSAHPVLANATAILDSIPDAFLAVDEHWQIVYVNRAAEQLLVGVGGPLLGANMWDAYPGLAGTDFERLYLETAAERTHGKSTGYYADHGRWYEASAFPSGNGIAIYVRDVSASFTSERAMRRSEARYRSLFDSIDEGFCLIEMLFDRDGMPCDYRFIETNRVFKANTGLTDTIGKRIRELVPTHEQHWFDIYGDVHQTGKPVRFEQEAKGLDRWYDVYAFAVDDEEGRQVAVLFKDITERRRREHELENTSRAKDEFLAMLAHELRNPLAPISAAADVLGMPGADTARIGQILGRQVRHMKMLVDDLLDVSRVTRGLTVLENMTVDLVPLVRLAVEQTQPLIDERGHRLAVDLPAGPVAVFGDPKRLVQVTANLLNNAAKYTPRGGRIALRLAVPAAQPDQVQLTIQDNGIGMPAALIDRAFDLFTQGQREADRAQGGLGVGLALVRTLVELHGGCVVAASAGPGEGCTFTVTLPRVEASTGTVPARDCPRG